MASTGRVLQVVGLGLLLGAGGCGPSAGELPPPWADGGTHDGRNNGGQDVAPLPHTLTAITVAAAVTPPMDPVNPILQVDLAAPAITTLVFSATGMYQDGQQVDITGQVAWASDTLGTFTGAELDFPPPTQTGAIVTKVSATLGSVVGYAQVTVVAYRMTGTQTDFFFILPFEDPAGQQQKPLDFKTDVRSLDVFFAMDTTASMTGEIQNLQSSLIATIVPQIQAQIADTRFGVGAVEDFPDSPSFTYGAAHGTDCTPYGGPQASAAADQPFWLITPITGGIQNVVNGVNALSINGVPIGCGMDVPEGTMEALYQIATGEGLTGVAALPLLNVPANHSGVGGVGFRQGSMPVVVPITDAVFHKNGEAGTCSYSGYTDTISYAGAVAAVAHTRAQTKTALNAICAKVVGVAAMIWDASTGCSPLADEEDFATSTGARVKPSVWDVGGRPAGCAAGQCCTGVAGAGRATDADGLCPLVFEIQQDGTGLGTSIVSGLLALTQYATFDVTTQTQGDLSGTSGEPLPSGTTTADFIKSIVPLSFVKPTTPSDLPDPVINVALGGFNTVTPGTLVTFQISAFNDFVAQTDQAQIFRAVIKVLAGSCTDLDQREVFILVPPTPIILG
jgi:hypothetical protein